MATATVSNITARDYRVQHPNDWCPGCGDFGILSAVQQAVAGLNRQPHEVAVFGGIGCSGKALYYVPVYGVHTLHGRVLSFATGAKLANPALTVVAVGGDGDGLGIGAGHFVNTGRRNVDLTYILFNNKVYGLTKGQAAPTLAMGLQPKSLPEPNIQGQLNPLMLAMASGFTWIGRGYAFNVKHLVALIQQAIEHPGLAYLDVLQPCPTYNNLHTKDWFAGQDLAHDQPRVYELEGEGYDPYIPAGASEEDVLAIMQRFVSKVYEWGDRIPTGVFLANRSVPTFAARIARQIPGYHKTPPACRIIDDAQGFSTTDISPLLAELTMTVPTA